MKGIKTYTEYALEVNDKKTNNFVKQIDVYQSYEEALRAQEKMEKEEPLDDEYYNIIFIDYDEDGNEIGFGSVV